MIYKKKLSSSVCRSYVGSPPPSKLLLSKIERVTVFRLPCISSQAANSFAELGDATSV